MRNITEYTEKEIDALEAGRDTDALVEHCVMGTPLHEWQRLPNAKHTAYCTICLTTTSVRVLWEGAPDSLSELCTKDKDKRYSTDISAAWDIVQKVLLLGGKFSHFVISVNTAPGAGNSGCQFTIQMPMVKGEVPDFRTYMYSFDRPWNINAEARGNHGAIAICKAALKAIRAMRIRESANA